MVFRSWSGITRRLDRQHPDAETGRLRTRPKQATRLSGEFPPYRALPRAEDRGGHRLQVELALQHQLVMYRTPCLDFLAPEELHVAKEVWGRIQIPDERLMSHRRGSGAAWKSAAAKLTDPNLAESTRNRPWLLSYRPYGGREERRRDGWREDARLRRGRLPEIWI
ncbi:hypothetical protein CSAL01_05526 [Colletotrichum salicis]|uniref:Uncharacterized protein n=1 Tax=Colletotrichum salicis TaxID=1209931 RepID=A0A135TTN3_9PEZI|nr:hypothetical protein CSAL01_05526 [Colletotrichum salicis]